MARQSDPSAICAVIVTFNPDADFASGVEAVRRQVPAVVIVDNASEDPPALERLANSTTELIRNPRNEGVARALNQGLARAIGQGFPWALTLDQDSRPDEGMVAELLRARDLLTTPEMTAVLGAHIVAIGSSAPVPYLRPGWGGLYQRRACEGDLLQDVTRVITSGSLVNLAAFTRLGGFREDFFIDHVDTEYCLRAQLAGYGIAVACRARLYHSIGNRRDANLAGATLQPTHHSPARWYYLSRNRVPMIRRYGLRFPHWLTHEIVAGVYGGLRMLLLEDQRWPKVRASLRGTFDGLRGRLGPGPYAAGLVRARPSGPSIGGAP